MYHSSCPSLNPHCDRAKKVTGNVRVQANWSSWEFELDSGPASKSWTPEQKPSHCVQSARVHTVSKCLACSKSDASLGGLLDYFRVKLNSIELYDLGDKILTAEGLKCTHNRHVSLNICTSMKSATLSSSSSRSAFCFLDWKSGWASAIWFISAMKASRGSASSVVSPCRVYYYCIVLELVCHSNYHFIIPVSLLF